MSDRLAQLRSLADGVGDLQHGQPGDEDHCTAADVIRWAVEEIERHKMTEKKLKLYVWRGFEPGWSGGLAFALAYTKDEARAAVEKAWRVKVNEWGRLRVHRVEAGRAEAMAGGG